MSLSGAYGIDPSSKPSIYGFYEVLWDRLYKGKVSFAEECMDETGISAWCVQSYQYGTPLSSKINLVSCSSVSRCSDVASCLTASKPISEIVTIFCAHPLYSDCRLDLLNSTSILPISRAWKPNKRKWFTQPCWVITDRAWFINNTPSSRYPANAPVFGERI